MLSKGSRAVRGIPKHILVHTSHADIGGFGRDGKARTTFLDEGALLAAFVPSEGRRLLLPCAGFPSPTACGLGGNQCAHQETMHIH